MRSWVACTELRAASDLQQALEVLIHPGEVEAGTQATVPEDVKERLPVLGCDD